MCQLLRAKYKKAGPTVPASQILKSKGGVGGQELIILTCRDLSMTSTKIYHQLNTHYYIILKIIG